MPGDAKLVDAATVEAALQRVRVQARALSDVAGANLAPLLGELHALESAIRDARERRVEDTRRFAHELRSPLNALAGWAQILRETGGNPASAAQAAAVIERSVAALAKIIQAHTD